MKFTKDVRVLVLILFFIAVNAEDVYVTSSSSSVCKIYYLYDEGDSLQVHYSGQYLSTPCELKFSSPSDDLCVETVSFNIGNCATTLKYYSGLTFYSSTLKEEYMCNDFPEKWCSGDGNIKVVIDKSSSSTAFDTNINLKVYRKVDDDDTDIIATIYIVIGCVVGGIIVIGTAIAVVVCCICYRRKYNSGMVNRNAPPPFSLTAQPPAGSYPTAATTNVAYSYSQPGAYPQTGYQPTVQVGYQPGYQPPHHTGYQTASNTDNKPAGMENNIALSLSRIHGSRAKIKELCNYAGQIEVEPSIPAKQYLWSGLEMLSMAKIYQDQGDLENAFILYMKFITIFVEKLPKHPGYKDVPANEATNTRQKVKQVFPVVERIKAKLMSKYKEIEQRRQEEEPPPYEVTVQTDEPPPYSKN